MPLTMRTLKYVATISITLALAVTGLLAQITPIQDAYTNSAAPTTNYGAQKLLDVESSQTTYIQFNLSSIPAGYTSADITKATLKLYVNAATKAGSFNVDYVNGTWSEGTIDASNAPALGTTIAASVPLTTADKNQYILIDITSAVQAWLSGTPNDGIALVGNSPLNASFDSKENTTTSHPAELDIVFAGGNGGGITGINTAAGSGLTGGGNSGTLNLSLITTCNSGQVLSWNGSAWGCTNAKGTGTVTSVGSGLGLTGGPITTSGTLSIDATKVPLLASSNTFTTGQAINASGNSDGLDAVVSGTNQNALLGLSNATSGESIGVYGISKSANGYAVFAENYANGYGVYGLAGGFGVWGQNGAKSGSGTFLSGSVDSGVWGDSGTGGNVGVVGTTDESVSGYFINNSPSLGYSTLLAEAQSGASAPFVATNDEGGYCYVDAGGDLVCSGSKNAAVPIDGGKRTVALAAIESPKNWFEDLGSAQLVNGSALVALDAEFTQTVNTSQEYQVFLTPYGDCKGLYVSNRTANSFEVHELGGGSASLSFGYRITALRRNYENVRFADHTHDLDSMKRMRERAHMNHPQPQSHAPAPPLTMQRALNTKK